MFPDIIVFHADCGTNLSQLGPSASASTLTLRGPSGCRSSLSSFVVPKNIKLYALALNP